MTTKVSVALATYNGARFLRPLLDSLAVQTRLPDELVVSDDASTDETLAIVEAFAADAPFRVEIVRHHVTVGVVDNFFDAFTATTGDILCYCDQDDVWHEDKIAKSVAPFADPAVRFVAHRSLVVDEVLAERGVIPDNARYGRLSFPVDTLALHAYGHQMAFDRRTLTVMEALRYSQPAIESRLITCFDGYIPFCAGLLGDLVLLKEPLVRFRRHAGTVSGLGKALDEPSRLQRMAQSAVDELSLYTGRAHLFARARSGGHLAEVNADRMERAFRRKVRVAQRIATVRRGNAAFRWLRLIPTWAEIAWRGDRFSNSRAKREAALALAASLPTL